MIIYLPLLVCILGLVFYLVAANLKTAEAGRLAFAIGLFAFLVDGARALQIVR